jgi:hypothetical protein
LHVDALSRDGGIECDRGCKTRIHLLVPSQVQSNSLGAKAAIDSIDALVTIEGIDIKVAALPDSIAPGHCDRVVELTDS